MKSIGEQLDVSPVGGDGGTIVHVSQVAHVTFYITDDGTNVYNFHLFSESEKRGLEECYQSPCRSFEEAGQELALEIAKLEEILEHKRKGMPTQKQVYFLFSNRIPIPLDLTWGQASDLIDEKMVQLDKEKQEYFRKKAEKFKGFTVGMQVNCVFYHPTRIEIGEVTKLTSNNHGGNYAYVKYDGNRVDRWRIEDLKEITERSINE